MRVKTSTELIETLRSEWMLLLSQSNNNNLFLTWEWIYSWCQNMLDHSMRPYILTVREKYLLIGLAPLVITQLKDEKVCIQFIGQQYSYHLGFIAESGKEKQVYKAVWEYLLNKTEIDFHSIEFVHFDDDKQFVAILDEAQKDRHLSFERSIQNPCKVLALKGSFDDYFHDQITSKNLRRKIPREYNRMSKKHRIVFFDADQNNITFYLDRMIAFHRELMDERNVHSALNRNDFTSHLKQVARIFLKKNKLHLNVMTIDDEPAVIMMCIEYNHVYNALTIGMSFHMMQKYPWFNLTYQSTIHNIEKSIQNNCDEFDFLGGQSNYKYRFGGVEQGGIKYNIYPIKTNNNELSKWHQIKNFLRKSVYRFYYK